jgi:molybdopterin-guanine dinucleotide biosynthesis protein B/molybdopterin-guanine dinucleotide biosynthesis protein
MKPKRTALILNGIDVAQPPVVFRGETLADTLSRPLREYFDAVATIDHDGSESGELLALAQGLGSLPDEVDGQGGQGDAHLFVASASMPFLQYRLMRQLYAHRDGHEAVVARVGGQLKPLCGVYSKSCARRAEELGKVASSASSGNGLPALLNEVDTLVLDAGQLLALDPLGLSFLEVEDGEGLARCERLLSLADGTLPPALSFVAKSGTGKTTLLEQVIAELTGRGWRVGSIKHHTHSFDIDHEGKDSWRHTRAGASPMLVSAPGQVAMVRPNPAGELPVEELIRRYLAEADIVITEGYKTGPLPKIEINRSGHNNKLLCVDGEGQVTDPSLVAVVSDAGLTLPVPLLKLNDVGGVCDFIEGNFLNC